MKTKHYDSGDVATSADTLRPGNYPIGSMESRAAARALLDRKKIKSLPPELEEAVANPLVWVQRHTRTRDSHWKEAGASTPYRPFPEKEYFKPLMAEFAAEEILFIEKSRDMMISWFSVALLTHAAMTTEEREVLFQTQKEDKAKELIDYAKTLYDQQDERLKQRFPLLKPLKDQAALTLEFANGSRIIGIPEGANQIRSYHPWGLLMDEAAFMPEAGEAYDAAISVCQKILVCVAGTIPIAVLRSALPTAAGHCLWPIDSPGTCDHDG